MRIKCIILLCVFTLSFAFSDEHALSSHKELDLLAVRSGFDINRPSPKELKRLLPSLGLSDRQVEAIIRYRRERGRIKALIELYSLDLSDEEVKKLSLYFTNSEPDSHFGRDISVPEEEERELENDLFVHPINLNIADRETLLQLPYADTDFVDSVIQFRNRRPIKNLLDLTNAGIVESRLLEVSPFISLYPLTIEKAGLSLRADIRFEDLLTNRVLYSTTNNSEWTSFYRFYLQFPETSFFFATYATNLQLPYAGIENFLNQSRFFARHRLGNHTMIVGDFELLCGEQLIFGSQYSTTPYHIYRYPIKKKHSGIKPYSSLDSDYNNDKSRDFYRGFAIALQENEVRLGQYYPQSELTLFASYFDYNPLFKLTNQLDLGLNFHIQLPMPTSTAGFNIAYQERYLGRTNPWGASLYYDIASGENLRFYGELASFDGFALLSGAQYQWKKWDSSILLYYSETNFLAPDAANIVRSTKNTAGAFIGAAYDFDILQLQLYNESYTTLSNPYLRTKWELRLITSLPLFNDMVPALEISLRSRYSAAQSSDYLRNYLYFSFGIGEKILKIDIRYQNILNRPDMTNTEFGQAIFLRVKYFPSDWLTLVLRNITYHSPNSACDFEFREERLGSERAIDHLYYGFGNETTLAGRLNLKNHLEISIKGIFGVKWISEAQTLYRFGVFTFINLFL